jgi:hypothetical protein
MGAYNRRLFADDYAAGGQLSRLPDPTAPLIPQSYDEPWRLEFLGSLRFDSILSKRLIVPDSHLLDGRFFLSLSASSLRAEIGRPFHGFTDDGLSLPIVLRLRRPTLRETVAEFLRTDDEHLNGFSFKTIPNEQARRRLANPGLAVSVLASSGLTA